VKRVGILVGIILLAGLLVPIRSVEAPLWTVCVVDETNKPAVGVTVRESYRNYSAEFRDNEQDLITDQHGCVIFPAKSLWAPLIQRGAAIISSANGGVHASFGRYVYVFAFADGREGNANKNGFGEDWTGSPAVNQSRIILLPIDLKKDAFESDRKSHNE
jgi:hypothetical protein